MRTRYILLTIPALAACEPAPGLVGVPEVRVASAAEVMGCQPIEIISTTPGLYGPVLGQQAIEYARNDTLATAREAGANTFVFDETPPGQPVYVVRGTAYRC